MNKIFSTFIVLTMYLPLRSQFIVEFIECPGTTALSDSNTFMFIFGSNKDSVVPKISKIINSISSIDQNVHSRTYSFTFEIDSTGRAAKVKEGFHFFEWGASDITISNSISQYLTSLEYVPIIYRYPNDRLERLLTKVLLDVTVKDSLITLQIIPCYSYKGNLTGYKKN